MYVLKKEDAAKETENTFDSKDAPKLDEKEQTGSVGDTDSSLEKSIEETQVKVRHTENDGEGESSEQLSTPPVKDDKNVEKETPNNLETEKSGQETNKDTNTNMKETPSHVTQSEIGGEISKTLETDEGNTIPPTAKTENGTDKHVQDEKQDENLKGCPKADEGNDEEKIDESGNVDEKKEEQSTGDYENNSGDPEIQNSEQGGQNQQTSEDTAGEVTENVFHKCIAILLYTQMF